MQVRQDLDWSTSEAKSSATDEACVAVIKRRARTTETLTSKAGIKLFDVIRNMAGKGHSVNVKRELARSCQFRNITIVKPASPHDHGILIGLTTQRSAGVCPQSTDHSRNSVAGLLRARDLRARGKRSRLLHQSKSVRRSSTAGWTEHAAEDELRNFSPAPGLELEINKLDRSIACPHDQYEDKCCVKQSLQRRAPVPEAFRRPRPVIAELEDNQYEDAEQSRGRWLRDDGRHAAPNPNSRKVNALI